MDLVERNGALWIQRNNQATQVFVVLLGWGDVGRKFLVKELLGFRSEIFHLHIFTNFQGNLGIYFIATLCLVSMALAKRCTVSAFLWMASEGLAWRTGQSNGCPLVSLIFSPRACGGCKSSLGISLWRMDWNCWCCSYWGDASIRQSSLPAMQSVQIA